MTTLLPAPLALYVAIGLVTLAIAVARRPEQMAAPSVALRLGWLLWAACLMIGSLAWPALVVWAVREAERRERQREELLRQLYGREDWE